MRAGLAPLLLNTTRNIRFNGMLNQAKKHKYSDCLHDVLNTLSGDPALEFVIRRSEQSNLMFG
jgi:hypothetical protein